MRNFEERKAEVFRRSENRIKERKRNRNRILTLCIPICLVLMVWSVATLPPLFTQKSNDAEYEDAGSLNGDTAPGSMGGFIEESKTHNYVSVSVKGKDYDAEITMDTICLLTTSSNGIIRLNSHLVQVDSITFCQARNIIWEVKRSL